jgi:type III pantothenate kinase
MMLDLVLDIGNSRVKGGFFDAEKKLMATFAFASDDLSKEELKHSLEGKLLRHVLVASVNSKAEETVFASLREQNLGFISLNPSALKLVLEVDEPEQLGHDRIANAYGALSRFPLNDCMIIDIGTAITSDFVAKEGRYLGGMIYPGAALCAKALADYTDKLPLVAFKKTSSPLAKTTQTHVQGGIYYGQLGAIERMIDALKLSCDSPSSVKVIATGGITWVDTSVCCGNVEFIEDLKELVDFIDPHLTLVGLHEILIELTKKG